MEPQQVEYRQKIKDHLRSAYLLSEEKIEAVLPRFLDTIKNLMVELENLAGSEENKEAISRTGHAMKGALLNLGLHDLAQKALSIEKHRELNDPCRNCFQLVQELRQELKKIF